MAHGPWPDLVGTVACSLDVLSFLFEENLHKTQMKGFILL